MNITGTLKDWPPYLCPSCRVDRRILRECWDEPPVAESIGAGVMWRESINHAQARFVIGNCPECHRFIHNQNTSEEAKS